MLIIESSKTDLKFRTVIFNRSHLMLLRGELRTVPSSRRTTYSTNPYSTSTYRYIVKSIWLGDDWWFSCFIRLFTTLVFFIHPTLFLCRSHGEYPPEFSVYHGSSSHRERRLFSCSKHTPTSSSSSTTTVDDWLPPPDSFFDVSLSTSLGSYHANASKRRHAPLHQAVAQNTPSPAPSSPHSASTPT